VCEIYTDVDGVYTADPNIVSEARKLDRISYDEMLELASLGAKVLQTRSVEYAKNYLVPVHVRSSFNDNPGTMVVEGGYGHGESGVSGIAYNKQEAKITSRGGGSAQHRGDPVRARCGGKYRGGHDRPEHRPGRVDRYLVHGAQDRLRAHPGDRAHHAEGDRGRQGDRDDRIAKVSIVGVGMRAHSGVAAKMFETLGREKINILMISTSEIKISCVIEAKYTELAVRVLHEAFGLARDAVVEDTV